MVLAHHVNRKAQITNFQFDKLLQEPTVIRFNEINSHSRREHLFSVSAEHKVDFLKGERILRFSATISSFAIEYYSQYEGVPVVNTKIVTMRFRFMKGSNLLYELFTNGNVLRITEHKLSEIVNSHYNLIRIDAWFEDQELPSDKESETPTITPLSFDQAWKVTELSNESYRNGFRDGCIQLGNQISVAINMATEENPELADLFIQLSAKIKELATSLQPSRKP